MGLKPHLTTIFKLLKWTLLGRIRHVFATRHLIEHWGVTYIKGSDDQVSKKLSKSSLRLYANENTYL